MKRKTSAAMKLAIDIVGRCELCGSRRGLQAHHIIPITCGGPDTSNNLVCVCEACHARLTPTSTLTKMGLQRTALLHALDYMFYFRCHEAFANYDFDQMDIFGIFEDLISKADKAPAAFISEARESGAWAH